jgi:type I restriction enzyme S subunit
MCAVVVSVPPQTYLNSFCFGFRLAESGPAEAKFLAYLFRSDVGRRLLRTLAQGAIRYNLAKSQFRELEIVVPPAGERRAIAAVLSDMDAEIQALEARLAKTRDIKQGTMQELLTGRTRLPVADDEQSAEAASVAALAPERMETAA